MIKGVDVSAEIKKGIIKPIIKDSITATKFIFDYPNSILKRVNSDFKIELTTEELQYFLQEIEIDCLISTSQEKSIIFKDLGNKKEVLKW